uniref:GNAT family N-acetyltransferase n=1 Tax=Eiseniibacteriota bacterium TaxID=2212470 RepID=A0A832I639_UNCEI
MTEQFLADPHLVADGMRLARAGDAAAGFVLSYALDEPDGAVHAFLRFGVAAAERRRGLGTRLLELGLAAVRAARPDRPLSGLSFGAWQPFDGADAFAARHGLVHARRFWRMERPAAPAAAPVWPAGIAVRTFDGSDAALADWNDVYNASFAGHWRFVPGTLEEARAIAAAPLFDPAGLALAYRDGRCLGFCRTESAGEIGVIGVLGTHPAARGLGLGRALLRWGVAHLAGRGFARIGLLVDGRNDGALALYRSEGFAVTRTREIWERVPA